ncbi:methyl-accepting chemotaxis protein, partial [Lichenibacterium ramalinae]
MMNALRNLTILRKIAAVFAVLVGLVALSGVLSYHLSGELQAAADRQTEAGRLVIAAKDALASAVDLSSHLRGLVMTRIPGNATDIAKDQERFDARIADARRATDLSADLAGQIDALAAAEAAWRRQVVDVVMPLTASVDTMDQASALMTTEINRKMVGDIRAAAAQVQATAKALADAAAARHADALAVMRGSSLTTTLVVALAAAALSWLLTRLIGTPVVSLTASMRRLAGGDVEAPVSEAGRRDEIGAMAASLAVFKAAAVEKLRLEADAMAAGRLTDAERARTAALLAEAAAQQTQVVEAVAAGLSRLSAGDLAQRIDAPFPADYERLRSDFNDAVARLQDTMRTVAASASAIRSGTGEISTASDDLSRRTEQQAASLEETAAALDEITATVRKTAQGSKHARSLVGTARGNAEQSGRVVRQAVEAMSGIQASSRQSNYPRGRVRSASSEGVRRGATRTCVS